MAKLMMMSMSLRTASLNKKLIANTYHLFRDQFPHIQTELLSFNDFPMTVYNGDEETQQGLPEGAKNLAKKILEHDALILATPEYNGGIAGPFKNAIDWVSRVTPMPWTGKHILLLGASPGALGAVRGLWHSRVPLEAVGAFVYPEMFGLPQAHQAFDEQGQFIQLPLVERLKALLIKFTKNLTR